MKTRFLLFLVSVLALYCVAQQSPNHDSWIVAGDGAIVGMNQIRSELNTENAHVYASAFDKSATWDGPLGQNAIGSDNIKRAAYLMFRTIGPLQFVLWVQRKVSADTGIVDMYQKVTNAHSASWKDIPAAPGSAAPPYGSDIRTTFVLKKKNTGWTVVAARVADLRLSKAKNAIDASISQ